MSKGYKDIGNERYYGCATRSEAAKLGGKGSGDNSLCTAKNVIDGDYGVTFVDNTVLSYEDRQAVAYVDLQKDTSTVEQEVNLELASVTCGVAMAEEVWQNEVVSEQHFADGYQSASWSGYQHSSINAEIISDTIPQGATIDYSAITYTWKDPFYTDLNSSYFTITKVCSYSTQSSDNTWGGYITFTNDFTTTAKTRIRIKLTFTPLKAYVIPDGTSNHTIEINIKVPYTSQVNKPVYKGNNYIPCKPSVSTASLLQPKQQENQTNVIQPASVSRNANIVNLVLQGPTEADYTYRSGTDLDNKQLGLIIPIQFSFNNVSTDAVELYAFGVDYILSEEWVDDEAYQTYGGYNVSSWFERGSSVIGAGCGGGIWDQNYPLYWKFYKMPDYADGNTDRIYQINSMFGNFSAVQNGFVLELKWNQKDHILPEGSVQTQKQLCSMRCELDITSKETGKKYRTTVRFNILLDRFKAVTSPPPAEVKPDRLYIRLKKTSSNDVFPNESLEQNDRYKVTFGEWTEGMWTYDSQCEDGSQWYYTDKLLELVSWDGVQYYQLGGHGISLYTDWGKYEFTGAYGINSIFTGNDDILEVIFPDRLNIIGRRCFANCKNLEKVTFKGKIDQIEADAFVGCNSLTIVDLSQITGYLRIGSHAFKGNANMQELIFSPGASLSVRESAFEDNTSMKMTIVGGQGFNEECGLNDVRDYAFNYCYNLGETLHLGYCNYIGLYAFENCSTVKTIYVEWEPGTTIANVGPTVATGAFKGCTNVQAIYSKGFPAIMHCCNIWYRKAINPQTAKLHVEASRRNQYANWAQFGDFNTYGNLIGDLS